MARESAGVLLFRVVDGRLEVFLVHPGGPLWAARDLGAWSVPKGEVELGEVPVEVAVRELEEETGIVLGSAERAGLVELGAVRQRGGKVVHAWAVAANVDAAAIRSNTFVLEWPPRSGEMREFPEVDRAGWFDAETACEKVNPAQRELVDRLRHHVSGQPVAVDSRFASLPPGNHRL